MPKIELTENDGYLYDSGEAEIFIFRVNGRLFPVTKSVTIGEFYKRVSALNLPETSKYDEVTQQPHHILPGPPVPGLVQALFKGITVGDIIRCNRLPEDLGDPTGKGKDNEKPVIGKEYLVQKVVMKNSALIGFEATPENSDWPQRVFLRAQDVELVKKGAPKQEPVVVISCIIPCNSCGKDVAATMTDNEKSYVASCECGFGNFYPREEITCDCGEKNFLLLAKGTYLGRCKKCSKDQKVPHELSPA